MTTNPKHAFLTVACQGWGVASPIEGQVEICVRFVVEGHAALHLFKSGLHQDNCKSGPWQVVQACRTFSSTQ